MSVSGALEIRAIGPEDVEQYAQLSHLAFGVEHTRERQLLAEYAGSHQALGVVHDGQLLSQLFIHLRGLWINGAMLPMGGIAGVTTAQAHRGHGYASRLLTAALGVMDAEFGQAVSILFPNVYPLYRRLGWAVAEKQVVYRGPAAAFRIGRSMAAQHGSAPIAPRVLEPSHIPIVQAMRRGYARRSVGMVERDGLGWHILAAGPLGGLTPTWLLLSEDEPSGSGGYALYTRDQLPTGQVQLIVDELVAPSAPALRQLLALLLAQPDVGLLSLRLGAAVPLLAILDDPLAVEVAIEPHRLGMLRIINLPAALNQYPVHDQQPAVSLTMAVSDVAAPWNAGTWRVTVDAGRVVCERARESTVPEISLDIATLGQLLVNYVGPRSAMHAGLLQVANASALDVLESLFPLRAEPWFADLF